MVLPFGEPKKALAVEGSTVLGVGSSNDYCTSGVNATFCTYADGMSLTQIGGGAGVSKYSDAVVLEMTLSLHTDGSNEVAHDQESGPNMGKVDWQDIGAGNSLWGAFYNVEDFTAAMGNNQSSSNGFFLRVGTAQTTRNEKQPPQKLISTPITNFVVRDPAKDLSDPTNDFKLGKSTASDSYGGANMLKVIATPATSFLETQTLVELLPLPVCSQTQPTISRWWQKKQAVRTTITGEIFLRSKLKQKEPIQNTVTKDLIKMP